MRYVRATYHVGIRIHPTGDLQEIDTYSDAGFAGEDGPCLGAVRFWEPFFADNGRSMADTACAISDRGRRRELELPTSRR